MSRDVEYDAVWIAELVLGIGGTVAGRPGVVLAAMRLDRLLHRIDVLYPDAEVVQADEVLAALVGGILFGLELGSVMFITPSESRVATRDSETRSKPNVSS